MSASAATTLSGVSHGRVQFQLRTWTQAPATRRRLRAPSRGAAPHLVVADGHVNGRPAVPETPSERRRTVGRSSVRVGASRCHAPFLFDGRRARRRESTLKTRETGFDNGVYVDSPPPRLRHRSLAARQAWNHLGEAGCAGTGVGAHERLLLEIRRLRCPRGRPNVLLRPVVCFCFTMVKKGNRLRRAETRRRVSEPKRENRWERRSYGRAGEQGAIGARPAPRARVERRRGGQVARLVIKWACTSHERLCTASASARRVWSSESQARLVRERWVARRSAPRRLPRGEAPEERRRSTGRARARRARRCAS